MLLSIIVPVYNVEKYLSRCIKSLVSQNLNTSDYEIILINDGSTDSSLKIAKDYAKEHLQIKVINQENKGQSAARNVGIKNCKGIYILFVDSDDYIEKNVLGKIIEEANDLKLDVLGFKMTRTSKSDYSVGENNPMSHFKNSKIYNGVSFISKHNYNNGPWWYIFRHDLIKKMNLLFEEGRMVEDGIFTTELLLNSKRISFYDIDVYRYFINLNSTTTKRNEKHLKKLNDDFKFVIKKFDGLIKIAKRKGADSHAIKRLTARQESYVFFLFVRLLKTKITFNEFRKVIVEMENLNVYPIKNFIGEDYFSMKHKILTKIFNNKVSLFMLVRLNRLFSFIK
ncbi:glycosyltransferase [Mariniflexile soesokkakense]|uniref:Glycosyltransferase n=1 Tax=Mariniflexile soesokkakense TaxID=1343160 RepID=A0ABV0AAJ7_9FLAO